MGPVDGRWSRNAGLRLMKFSIERAAATSRDVQCGNSSRKRDEKPFQDAATVIISYFNFIDEFLVYIF